MRVEIMSARAEAAPLTRRILLSRIGGVGGAGMMAAAMQTAGLFSAGPAAAVPALPAGFGKGRKVIVLGAGVAGLVSAYELQQAGFAVTVLEARARVGGRAWTIRDGDQIEMIGEPTQTAKFSPGIYFNAGPARLPSFPPGDARLCQKFGVPLEVEVNPSASERRTPYHFTTPRSARMDFSSRYCAVMKALLSWLPMKFPIRTSFSRVSFHSLDCASLLNAFSQ